MKIGELAEKAGVSIDTVRFYERRGLISEPQRRDSGYRIYTADFVERIRFIKRGQELGFTLSEIQDLLSLRVSEDTSCAAVRQQAEAKLQDVEEKIRDLERVREALLELASACTGSGPVSDCPILESMTQNGREKL